MKYTPPKSIELTNAEAKLYSRITLVPGNEDWTTIADAMESLVTSLLERGAVPDVRLSLFDDPKYAETGHKSRQSVFESNGTRGRDIFRHPHFIPYLNHFIHGPDLPRPVIEGLCRILNDDSGTSGMVLDQYCRYARSCMREFKLERSKAATEFFRLGVEIGMALDDARSLRKAARSGH